MTLLTAYLTLSFLLAAIVLALYALDDGIRRLVDRECGTDLVPGGDALIGLVVLIGAPVLPVIVLGVMVEELMGGGRNEM